MTVTDLTKTDTLTIDILRDGALSLAGIAKGLRLLVRETKIVVAGLEREGVVANRLDDSGDGKRSRVFYLAEGFLLRERAELGLAAESADKDELEALTKAALRIALSEGFGLSLLKKTKKAALVARILKAREALFAVCRVCGEEPVDFDGEVCGVCEAPATVVDEEEQPTGPARSRAPRRVDADLSDLSDDDLAEVTSAALAQTRAGKVSARGAQRAIALWLGARSAEGFVPLLILRTLCKRIGVLNSANFTINMKKDGALFARVESDGNLIGWSVK